MLSKYLNRWLCLVIITLAFLRAGSPCAESGAGEKSAAGAVNAFSVELFRRLATGESGNLVVSPYSIECALALTAFGASGETETQMLAAMRLQPPGPGGKRAVHAGLGALSRRLAADADEFSDATMLAHAKGIRMRDEYLAGVADIYRSTVRAMDFANARRAANDINAWVAEATRGMVKKLIDKSALSADTVAVIVNALAFHGKWEHAFSPDDTRPGPFTTPDGAMTAEYMTQSLPVTVLAIAKGGVVASEWDGRPVLARMAALPFIGGEWEMVFFHPDSMQAFLDALTPENMHGWLGVYDDAAANSGRNKVTVSIPKFAFSWGDPDRTIIPALKDMGMRDAFGPAADFGGMTGEGGFGISDILHQARIEVDESGAKAAAATAVVVTRSASRPKEFVLDSPFVFLVRHSPTGAVILLGRVDRPEIQGT